MYLFGAFVSGWVKRRRGEIVAVGIVIMIVIVLLSGGGGQKQLRVDMCWWGGSKNSVEWISCRFFLFGYSYSLLYSRLQCY